MPIEKNSKIDELYDMIIREPWESVAFGIAIIVVVIGVIIFIHPKQHQGYYIVKEFDGSIPVYCLMNNWAYWPDTDAFISTDIKEIMAVWRQLGGYRADST